MTCPVQQLHKHCSGNRLTLFTTREYFPTRNKTDVSLVLYSHFSADSVCSSSSMAIITLFPPAIFQLESICLDRNGSSSKTNLMFTMKSMAVWLSFPEKLVSTEFSSFVVHCACRADIPVLYAVSVLCVNIFRDQTEPLASTKGNDNKI